MMSDLAYTTRTLAQVTPFGEKYIRQCIQSKGGPGDPPPLKAKRGPRGAFVITAAAANEWLDQHEDA